MPGTTTTPSLRTGSGEPLVLLHGILGSWRIWAPVIEALSAEHDVYAPTVAGHRGAAPLADGVTVNVAALADALEADLDAQGIETAHIAGNSLGGWLALELARRGRARSVVALSPAGGWTTDADLARVTRMLAMGVRSATLLAGRLDWAAKRPRARKLLLRDTMEHGERLTPVEARDGLADVVACTIFEGFIASTQSDGPFAGDMSAVTCPIRVAWSEQDRVIPYSRYGPPLLAHVPQAELITLPGVGHVPMYDDPELIARTILEVTTATTTEEPMTETTLTGSHGALFVRRWENPDARYIALVAHGIAEHSGRYEHVAKALVDSGAEVYAPDHYGHGRSDGEAGIVEDVEAFVDDLHLVADLAREQHPGLPLVLVGHSMGGMIATRYAQRHGDELTALVLSAPFIGGNPAFEGLLAMDPIPDVPLDPAMLSRDPAVGEAYAADPLVYHGPLTRTTLETMFAAVKTVNEGPKLEVPTLWLHGTEDPLAPFGVTGETIERLRTDAVSEKSYPGAMHEIFNETNQDEVIGDAVAFIETKV